MISTRRKEVPMDSLYHWHTVLIVDDDPGVLGALRRALEREPYDVVTTDRPALALDWMTHKNVSLVISDQRMPEMTGSEMIAEIRGRSPGTQCMLLTAYPGSVTAGEPSWTDIGKMLLKPWDDQQLRRVVRHMLFERETGYRAAGDEPDLGGEGG